MLSPAWRGERAYLAEPVDAVAITPRATGVRRMRTRSRKVRAFRVIEEICTHLVNAPTPDPTEAASGHWGEAA